MDSARVPGIVLAGGNASQAFAEATGLSHRALLQVPDPEGDSGTPPLTMLELAIRALQRSARISEVHVITDLETPDGVRRIADHGGFVDNLFAGLDACSLASRACICTADIPFVTSRAVDRFLDAAWGLDADVVYPIVSAEVCAAAHPGMRRTSLPTREGRFTGGNMVLVRPAALLAARTHIEAAHANRKSPLRLAMMLGLDVTIAVALSMLTGRGLVRLGSLERAVSRLINASARALVSDDPSIATDVDRPGDAVAVRTLARGG